MVGRNDPCICGSGKKYKKCCALKNETSTEALIDDELWRVIQGYFENVLDNPAVISDFERCEREWKSRLNKSMDDDEIHNATMGYFLFVARRDLWNRYILKVLNGQVRPKTREILTLWQNPIVLLGKITKIRENYFEVNEILGNQTYTLKLEEDMDVKQGLLVFGVVLPDERKYENGVMMLDGLTFIEDRNGKFAEKISQTAEESGQKTSHDFFKTHMIDIHKIMAEREIATLEDIVDRELTSKEQNVITLIEDELDVYEVSEEDLDFVKMIAVSYLIKENPSFRKPEIIAAAAVIIGMDINPYMLPFYKQAEIAEMFGVSVSSMMKHADKLADVVDELAEDMDNYPENTREISYTIGTDPLPTEVGNWRLFCKMETIEFELLEDVQAAIPSLMNEPFDPKGNKQKAQAIAYDAYESKDMEKRFQLAKKVITLDSQNIDGLLLQTDFAGAEEKAEELYRKAIALGEKEFNDEPEIPWALVTNRPYMRAVFAYGIWLYESKRFGEAAEQFEKLLEINREDHQGARYLAIASHLYTEEYERASDILDVYEDHSFGEAAYLYLSWLLEMDLTEGESEIGDEIYEEAYDVNPYVAVMMNEAYPKPTYPKRMYVSPGSAEEAMYVWYLLN